VPDYHEFPTEWHRFLNPASASGDQTVTLGLTRDRFPFVVQDRQITIRRIEPFIKVPADFIAANLRLTLAHGDRAPDAATHQPSDLLNIAPWNGLLRAERGFDESPGNWTMTAWIDDGSGPTRVNPAAIRDFVLVCDYVVG
jgi:hypothetical protein